MEVVIGAIVMAVFIGLIILYNQKHGMSGEEAYRSTMMMQHHDDDDNCDDGGGDDQYLIHTFGNMKSFEPEEYYFDDKEMSKGILPNHLWTFGHVGM